MIIEVQGNIYKLIHEEFILKDDLYYDGLTCDIKKCDRDNFFDPWSVKVKKIQENENKNN